jgi:hypothetical protein
MTTDTEAVAYLSAQLGPALRIQEAVADMQTPIRSSKSASDPTKGLRTELLDSALRLVASMVTWHWTDRMLRAAQGEEKDSLPTWLEQSTPARKWLTTASQRGTLPPLSAFVETLAGIDEAYPAPVSTSSTPPCTDYIAYLDRTYPVLAGSAQSWLGVAEQEGLKGLKARFEDTTLASGLSLANQRLCARTYLETRLSPVFRAQLIARALSVKAEAERDAQTLTTLLQRWPERKREVNGLARLCGTWQWSIHNHRHHQESKTMMTFPPVDGPTPPGLRPSKIAVMGDAVYIRWDFQGGFQEESLLFGGEGARLEGTFINSTGAWGSITGKRTAPCPR